MTLNIGNPAPSFTLTNQSGEKVSLSDYRGKWVITYFYPRALTPGCTTQACALTDARKELDALNAVALGISADKVDLLKRFEEKKGLNLTLLSDVDKKTIEAYGAWGRKKFMGKEYDGIFRVTYIIDPQGKIAHFIPKVKTKTHHEDVINWLKENT